MAGNNMVISLSVVCFAALLLFIPLAHAGPRAGVPENPAASAVVLKDGRITVSASNAELLALLNEIAKRVPFELTGKAPGDERVSVSFKNLTIEEALQRILKRRNYLIVYEEEARYKKGGGAGIKKVILLPKGSKTDKTGKQAVRLPVAPGAPPHVQDTQDASAVAGEIIRDLLHDDPQIQTQGVTRLRQHIDELRNLDPEKIGALSLILGEETRGSGIAGLREIYRRGEGGSDAAPRR